MPCPEIKKPLKRKKNNPKKKERVHTPIMSEAQRGLFGAELARRRAGKKGRMSGITTEELERHLRESKGADLPAKVKLKRKKK